MDYGDYGGYEALAAMFALLGIVFFIIGPIYYVVSSIFMMKIFEKAGAVGKWRAWVPIYREMIFFKLGDMSPWLVLYTLGATIVLSFVGLGGIVGLAFTALFAMAGWRVGLKLQKEAAWVILFVLLNIVWMGIVAFDRSRWNSSIAPAPWAGNGFLGDNTVWDGIPVQAGQNVAPAGGYGAPQGYSRPHRRATPRRRSLATPRRRSPVTAHRRTRAPRFRLPRCPGASSGHPAGASRPAGSASGDSARTACAAGRAERSDPAARVS